MKLSTEHACRWTAAGSAGQSFQSHVHVFARKDQTVILHVGAPPKLCGRGGLIGVNSDRYEAGQRRLFATSRNVDSQAVSTIHEC